MENFVPWKRGASSASSVQIEARCLIKSKCHSRGSEAKGAAQAARFPRFGLCEEREGRLSLGENFGEMVFDTSPSSPVSRLPPPALSFLPAVSLLTSFVSLFSPSHQPLSFALFNQLPVTKLVRSRCQPARGPLPTKYNGGQDVSKIIP